MGYVSWHNYGYGICTDSLDISSVEQITALLDAAPCLKKRMAEWLESEKIQNPTVEDYLEYDQAGNYGIATILAEAIQEVEGIIFTACNDYDGKNYLIYQPSYPWYLRENERDITEEQIEQILRKYVSLLVETELDIDYQEVENGG